VTLGDSLKLDFLLCFWIDFRLWFIISSFVGSSTLFIFVSFQQKKDI